MRSDILNTEATTTASRKQQSGSFLIEALVSVLLFMVGLIGLMGASAQAVNQLSQSKYRNDASFLSEELIGEIWVAAGTSPAAPYLASANYAAWQARVQSTLPGGTGTATVNVPAANMLTLVITWPDAKNPGITHTYQTTTLIAK